MAALLKTTLFGNVQTLAQAISVEQQAAMKRSRDMAMSVSTEEAQRMIRELAHKFGQIHMTAAIVARSVKAD